MKSLSRRSKEAHKLRHQLEGLGLTEEYTGMTEIYQALHEFSMKGIEVDIKLQLHGVQRLLIMKLTLDSAVYSSIFLQYTGDEP